MTRNTDILEDARDAYKLAADHENENRLAALDDLRFGRLGEPFNIRCGYVCWKHFNMYLESRDPERYWAFVVTGSHECLLAKLKLSRGKMRQPCFVRFDRQGPCLKGSW